MFSSQRVLGFQLNSIIFRQPSLAFAIPSFSVLCVSKFISYVSLFWHVNRSISFSMWKLYYEDIQLLVSFGSLLFTMLLSFFSPEVFYFSFSLVLKVQPSVTSQYPIQTRDSALIVPVVFVTYFFPKAMCIDWWRKKWEVKFSFWLLISLILITHNRFQYMLDCILIPLCIFPHYAPLSSSPSWLHPSCQPFILLLPCVSIYYRMWWLFGTHYEGFKWLMQYTTANFTYFCTNFPIDNQDHSFKGTPLAVI